MVGYLRYHGAQVNRQGIVTLTGYHPGPANPGTCGPKICYNALSGLPVKVTPPPPAPRKAAPAPRLVKTAIHAVGDGTPTQSCNHVDFRLAGGSCSLVMPGSDHSGNPLTGLGNVLSSLRSSTLGVAGGLLAVAGGGTAAAAAWLSGVASSFASTVGPSLSAQVVEQTAQDIAAKGTTFLNQFLSVPEQLAMARNPSLAARFLGQAVHRATTQTLQDVFPGRFVYSTKGPDFLDTWNGTLVELTTLRDVGNHLVRGGSYLIAKYATYMLP